MHPKYHLISAIFHEPWFISVDFNLELINALVSGVMNPNITAESEAGSYEPQKSGRVAVIPIIGVLTKYDGFCGAPGMQTYGERIKTAISDPSIDAIILKFDTPGGQVSGAETLANIIESSPKIIYGFVDDMACSGGYLLLSKCKRVFANNPLAQVGSIGVMANYEDYTVANEKAGKKVHRIYAPQSKDKNKTTRQIESGDYSKVEQELGVFADRLIASVVASRPAIQEEHLTGGVFFAKDVVGTLVDEIGTIEQTAAHALSQVKSNKKMSKTTNTARLASVIGVEALESLDGIVSINAEQLTALESHLENTSNLATANENLTSQLTVAQDEITTVTAERNTAQARVTELEASAGAQPSRVSTPVDVTTVVGQAMTQASAEAEAKKYL